MMNGRKIMDELKPVILMVSVQITFAGVNILYEIAAIDQLNLSILVAYRLLFSALLIVPAALYLERNKRPKLTWMILFQSFICALFGATMSQNLFAKSLELTSATFAVAINNLTPAMTFTLGIIFGLEKLGWRSGAGKAKVVGTLVGIGGAMLLTFYKGCDVKIWTSPVNLLTLLHHHHNNIRDQSTTTVLRHQSSTNMIFGAILALACVISTAIWLIIQAKMMVKYPCPYSSTALLSVMGSLQAVVYVLCTEKDWSQWKLGWNIRLFTVAYSGILGSGVMFTFVAWCVQMRGPLFVSIFNPLMLVLVAIAGSLLLEEQLHLGSVLGSVLIVCGLYLVIWGKSKDVKIVPEPEEDVVVEKDKQKGFEIGITCLAETATPSGEHNTGGNGHISSNQEETLARDLCFSIVVVEAETNSEEKNC